MTLRRRPQTATRTLTTDLVIALLAAIAGTAWLSWLDASDGVRPNDVIAVINESATVLGYSLPFVMLVVPALLAVMRRRGFAASSTAAVAAVAAASAVAVSLASQLRLVLGLHDAAGVRIGAMTTDALTSFVVLFAVGMGAASLLTLRTTTLRTATRAVLVLAIGVTGSLTAAFTTATPVNAAVNDSSCLDSSSPADKIFDVTALDVDIPINRFGDHDPKGKMYALNSQLGAIPAEAATQTVSIGLGDDPIQPLAIRANEGDCVEIHFTNSSTGGDYGMHIDGLEFNQTSSGDHIGANPSSAVPNGSTTTYRFAVPLDNRLEGAHYIHPGPGYRAAVDHGLFGALVVEPPGSTYWDATTSNKQLDSGWEAIIKPAGVDVPCDKTSTTPTCAFREAVLMHHEIGNDNEAVTTKSGGTPPVIDPITGTYRSGAFALNYRSEPFRNRLLSFPKEKAHAYSSYTFGDPATPIMRGYLADPTKIRLLHAGGEKFHVFHLHGGGDRWRFNPVGDPTFNYADTGLHKTSTDALSASQRLDSQAIGPGESYNLEIEGGAGGVQQSVGDFLFHCHIAKHYVSGMWAMWRVFNTSQPDLVPLSDRNPPPDAVDSRGLIGRTYNGVKLTKSNLDAWIRPQLPPSGVPRDGQDPNVWDWKIAGTTTAPLYLGAPGDPTVFPDSPQVIDGQPNLLAIDAGHIVGNRPAILFDPVNGRPAYPLLRPNIGKRPPFTAMGHSGAPYLGNNVGQAATSATDPFAKRPDGLCPTTTGKLRTYNIVAIGKPIRRTPSFVDDEGKIFVLAHNNTAGFRADPNQGTPLAIRANQGDCVAITLTNEIPDASAFDHVSKVEMHIHHVQFDVQGSDGVSTGFAYEHSVRPYTVEDPSLTASAAKGATVLHLTDVTKFMETDANGKPSRPWIAVGEGLESIDIHQIASVNPTNKTITLATKLNSAHASGQFAGDEYVQYRWYPDVLLDNIFWHDHVDGIHGWGHGLIGQLIVEPKGSTYHDPVTGAEVDSGPLVDIQTSSPLSPGVVDGSFRELALWTINDNDQAAYSTLNLKANPLVDRQDKPNQFSSYTYGDPLTPLPRLYPNDPLVVRSLSVSPTVDTLHFQGAKSFLEPRETDGTLIDTIHAGISERFTMILNGSRPDLRMQPGDYLYNTGGDTHTQQGAWGIVRVLPGQVSNLQPLPGVDTPSNNYVLPTQTNAPPPATTDPGSPCPTGAPTRSFKISAMDRSATYNGARTGYVPDGDVAAIKARTKSMQPLVLHVVAGECVTVNVTNLLTNPVGFSVAKLDRDAGSGGVNVGFDSDQNVAPNATRAYVYYVQSDKIGTATIGDLSSATTLKSGLYGTVVVAPASKVAGLPTEFSDPVTGLPRDIGPQVIVHVPGGSPQDYRDFTVDIADDDARIGQDFMPYPTDAVAGRSLMNYQAAPAGDGSNSYVDSGAVPTMTSYAGDPVVVHSMVAPGSENIHVFGLGGLSWERDSNLARSELVSEQGIGPWETYDSWILGGAGGLQNAAGDYFYGDMRRPFTQIGLWGLQRVLPANSTSCPMLRVDGSAC